MNNRIVFVTDDGAVNFFPPSCVEAAHIVASSCIRVFGLRCILITCFAREQLAEMLERVIQPLVYTRTALCLYFVTGVLLQSAGWLQRGMWTATLRVAGGQKIGASCYFKSTLQCPHINRNKNCAEKKKTLSELIWRSIKSMKKKEKTSNVEPFVQMTHYTGRPQGTCGRKGLSHSRCLIMNAAGGYCWTSDYLRQTGAFLLW